MKINITNIKQNKRHFKLIPKTVDANITLPELAVNPTLMLEGKVLSFCLSEKIAIPPPPDEGQIGESEVTDEGWSLITYDELGTVNPTYTTINPTLGEVTVTSHACFKGQSITILGSGAHSIFGSVPTKGVNLSFNLDSGYYTQIKEDGASPNTPVLAGNVGYYSPISVLFSGDVHAVALTGGHFDSIGSTYIEVYDRLGNVLGSALNTQLGIETFGFSVGSQAKIAGFSFYVNNSENAGFAMDNLRFAMDNLRFK